MFRVESSTIVFVLVCCSPPSEACLLRVCTCCLHKSTAITAQQELINAEWLQWEWVKDQATGESYFNTKIVKHTGTLAELIQLYEHLLRNETTAHVCLVENQSREFRKMINNCNEKSVIVHVDFAEAWKCKYSSEVQSCHFARTSLKSAHWHVLCKR